MQQAICPRVEVDMIRVKEVAMTMRFWLAGGSGVIAVALIGGIGLGTFVTRIPTPSSGHGDWSVPVSAGDEPDLASTAVVEQGPREVHCTGCGPTLSERRSMKAMAGLDDNWRNPAPQDYSVPDYAAQPYRALPITRPAPALSATIERFAVGESAPPPVVPVAMTANIQDQEAPPIKKDATLP